MNEVLCLNPTHTLSIYDKDVLFAKETCCHWKKGMLQQLNMQYLTEENLSASHTITA